MSTPTPSVSTGANSSPGENSDTGANTGDNEGGEGSENGNGISGTDDQGTLTPSASAAQ